MCRVHSKGSSWTRAKKRAFLKALRIAGNILEAAEAAGMARQTFYRWTERDPDFAADAAEALESYADTLEKEIDFRATRGLRQYKFYQGRPVMVPCSADHPEAVEMRDGEGRPSWMRHYYERRPSDLLMMFRLKKLRPEYRDRPPERAAAPPAGESTSTYAEHVRRMLADVDQLHTEDDSSPPSSEPSS